MTSEDSQSFSEEHVDGRNERFDQLVEAYGLVKDAETDKRNFEFCRAFWTPIFMHQQLPFPELDDEADGGGAKIIDLSDGWRIVDHGHYLASSPGEDYGTYCTGKMIATILSMLLILGERGVTLIAVYGGERALRTTWIFAEYAGIEVGNFYPTESDFIWAARIATNVDVRNRIEAYKNKHKGRLQQLLMERLRRQ